MPPQLPESEFERLYTRVLEDQEFGKRLAADPAAALEELRIRATPELIYHIRQIASDVEYLNRAFGGSKGMVAT